MDHNCVWLRIRWRGRGTDLFSSSCSLSSDKPMDLKQGDKESILKPFTLVTAKPKQDHRQQTTTAVPAVNSTSNTTLMLLMREIKTYRAWIRTLDVKVSSWLWDHVWLVQLCCLCMYKIINKIINRWWWCSLHVYSRKSMKEGRKLWVQARAGAGLDGWWHRPKL